jgi:hypothetical protein
MDSFDGNYSAVLYESYHIHFLDYFSSFFHLLFTFILSDLSAIYSTTQMQRMAASRSPLSILRAQGSKDWLKSSPYLTLFYDYLIEIVDLKSGAKNPGVKSGVQYFSPSGRPIIA